MFPSLIARRPREIKTSESPGRLAIREGEFGYSLLSNYYIGLLFVIVHF